MDLGPIERALRAAQHGAIVCDPRLLRRVIKAHRRLPGLGLAVPHAKAYALPREALLGIIEPRELGHLGDALPDDVVLVARPSSADVAGKSPPEVTRRLWRAAFHEHVHLALERRFASGAIDDAGLRARIDKIGQTEFDEARAILRRDDRLLPPVGDREVYTELAALWLELHHFAPPLLRTVLPGLADETRIGAAFAPDVDALSLLDASCPEGAEGLATVVREPKKTTSFSYSQPATLGLGKLFAPAAPSALGAARLVAKATIARAEKNLVRAALLSATAATREGPDAAPARAQAAKDLEALGARLDAALGSSIEWTSLLLILAEGAAANRGLRYPIEARLLYDLQRAALAHERVLSTVDLVGWALSRGRRPVVRELPALRELYVLRHLRAAQSKVRHVRVARAERKLLGRLLAVAVARADDRLRGALGPKIRGVLGKVGLQPANLPERVAEDKLVEELLDQASARGFLSLGHLRDALSKNQLKLDNLSSAVELWQGDALLAADRMLADELDGIYRRGEAYLRGLQKASSVAFGTKIGRTLVRFVLLPVGGAFVLLEAGGHLLAPVFRALDLGEPHFVTLPPDLPTPLSIVTAILLLALLHSEAARSIGRRALGLSGVVLASLFLRMPRWVLSRPSVRRALGSAVARLLLRHIVVPAIITAVFYALTPLSEKGPVAAFLGAAAMFLAVSLLAGTRIGLAFEDIVFDWLAPTWTTISRRVLPGLFRLTVDTFRALAELVERILYKVDEALRFHKGGSSIGLALRAAFGVVWFLIAYVVRLYFTLLVEPEINPLKHFPVVTVAHKIMIPFAGDVLSAFSHAAAPLGTVVGGAVAGTTAFLLPSVFGFLAWELRENWRLYRQSRPETLQPSIIGHHGETVAGLMVPGFHSGTLPKLFERMRRAAQREEAEQEASSRPQAEGAVGAFREGIAEVEHSVRRFVERELVPLCTKSPRWPHGSIRVAAVHPSSNRVRVELACPKLGAVPCAITFEEQSGLLVAGIAEAGFLSKLTADEPRLVFENALAGLYHMAGVDLVREQIEAALGGDIPYDVSDEGLVAWPSEGYRTEAVYAIHARRTGPTIEPVLRGDPPTRPVPPLEARQVLFRRQAIAWSAWVYAWSAAEANTTPIPRLVQGPSILPPAK